jgi:hypothetical protein
MATHSSAAESVELVRSICSYQAEEIFLKMCLQANFRTPSDPESWPRSNV